MNHKTIKVHVYRSKHKNLLENNMLLTGTNIHISFHWIEGIICSNLYRHVDS